MSKQKGQRDFLTTCMNSMNVDGTVQDFQQAFCSVCVNPECTRSRWADSQWIKRMLEQEKVLNNPTIIDPSGNSEFQKIASQDFISISDEDISFYGGWVDVKENGKVVHHSEPETENKSSNKVEQSLSSLKKDTEPTPEESDSDPEETEIHEEIIEEEIPSQFQQPQEPKDPKPQKKKTRRKKNHKNTPKPQGGVTLDPSNQSPFQQRNSTANKPSLVTKEDPWAAPKPERKGKLKVRINDGKVVEGED